MFERAFKLSVAAVLAGMTLSPPIALAAPSLGSPEMQRALAEAANGPDDLRRYVHRTRA